MTELDIRLPISTTGIHGMVISASLTLLIAGVVFNWYSIDASY